MNAVIGITLPFIIVLNIYSMFKFMAIAMDKDKIEEVENRVKSLSLFGRVLLEIYLILIAPLILIMWITYVISLVWDGIGKLLKKVCFRREK